MIENVDVIGARGRVGSAVSARLAERGIAAGGNDPDLVLLCVPDRAIAEVAAGIEPGPWVAHVSGGTPLAALAPHARRFSLHPLQTFTHDRGPEQLDGAWAAVTGESDEALALATALAGTLGLKPFDARRRRAGAVPRRRGDRVQLPRHAPPGSGRSPRRRRRSPRGARPAHAPHDREPLPSSTGPIERGDWETVERHRAAIAESSPELLEAYRRARRADRTRSDVGGSARVIVARTVADTRAALADRRDGRSGLVPTMGALHGGHAALLARRPAGMRHRRDEPVREPRPVRRPVRPERLPARRGARPRGRASRGRRRVLRPARRPSSTRPGTRPGSR